MKKRIVLLISLVFLLVATFAVSAVVASVEKVPVTATQAGAAITFSPETGINEGGILHIYATTAGKVTLNIGGDGSIGFDSSANLMVIINTETKKGVIHFDMTWAKTGGGGAFEGQVNGIITDYLYNPSAPPGTTKFAFVGTMHVVFQGSGVFRGQTLMLDGTRGPGLPPPATPLKWEGMLLTH